MFQESVLFFNAYAIVCVDVADMIHCVWIYFYDYKIINKVCVLLESQKGILTDLKGTK